MSLTDLQPFRHLASRNTPFHPRRPKLDTLRRFSCCQLSDKPGYITGFGTHIHVPHEGRGFQSPKRLNMQCTIEDMGPQAHVLSAGSWWKVHVLNNGLTSCRGVSEFEGSTWLMSLWGSYGTHHKSILLILDSRQSHAASIDSSPRPFILSFRR